MNGAIGAAGGSLLRPDDRLRVIVAGERVQERAMRPAGDATGFGPHLGRGLGSSLNDALVFALMGPADPARGHLVVVYTDGLESWSTLGAERVVQVAARADAVLHTVVVGRARPSMAAKSAGVRSDSGTVSITWHGSLPRNSRRSGAPPTARSAPRCTGGSLHHVGAGENAFAAVLDDFRSSYLFRYMPRGVDSTGWHEIAVRVRRPGSFTVRAKKGYERDR